MTAPSERDRLAERVPRKNSFWRFQFWGTDARAERERVRKLFTDHGFSVGRRQRGAPAGILFGDFDIQKWRNLRPADRETLHGRLHEDDWPIVAEFPAGLPDDVDDALLVVSHADLEQRRTREAASKARADGGGRG